MRAGTGIALAVTATVLVLGVSFGATPVAGATRTLTPEEESAIPTVDPAHMVPDEVMVQFSRPLSSAELQGFEERFHLTLLSTLDFGDDGIEPYYQFHIDDGVHVIQKRLEILAGEPLVAWCQPNVIGETLSGAATPPSQQTMPAQEPSSATTPSPVVTATPSSDPSSAGGDPSPGPPLLFLAVGAIALMCLAAGGLGLMLRRRSR
jgi:hypothetical protein